jgi:hypothetical protein
MSSALLGYLARRSNLMKVNWKSTLIYILISVELYVEIRFDDMIFIFGTSITK